MRTILFVALGGSLGAVSRFLLSRFVNQLGNGTFPWGTLAVNLIGCYVIGLLYEFLSQSFLSADLRNFVIIGFLGAFTTFSSYALETMILMKEANLYLTLLNVLYNNILGTVLVIAGVYSARSMLIYAR